MAVIKLESFDNPSYTVPADLVSAGGWNAQGGIEYGTYNHAGSYGIKFTYQDYLRYSGFTRVNILCFGFWIKITQFSTYNSQVNIFRLSDTAYDLNTHIIFQTVRSSTTENIFKFRVTDRSSVDGTTSFNIDTWYYVKAKVYIHDTAGYFYFYVNDSLEISGTDRDTKHIGVDGSNWIEFLCSQNTGQIHYIDSFHLLNTTGASPTDLLPSCDVVWDGSTNAIQYSWTEPSVGDDANNLADVVLLNLNTHLSISDDANNLNDAVENAIFNTYAFYDSMYHFYDGVVCYLAAWHVPLTVEITDSLNLFEDQLDSVEYVQLGADITLEVGDILYLTDTITVKCDIALSIEDDLNEWQDEVAIMPGEFVDYAYDTMMYDFLDSIELDFRLHRGVSDTMVLSDTVSTNLAAYLQTTSVSDNAANLSDAINLRISGFKSVVDNLALYDFVKLSMSQALNLADTLSMSDAVSVQLSVTDASLEDSLDLWNDLVTASLSAKVDQNVSDSMSQSDAVSAEIELGEDLRYYRRYLNDVSA